MQARVTEGTIVLRQWDRAGLTETPRAFNTLDELYALCLNTADPAVVDRIIIHGHDEHGQPHVLTFVFQSITVTPQKR
jgi:hypothetical protein